VRSVAAVFRGQRQAAEAKTPVPYTSRYAGGYGGNLLAPSGAEAQMRAMGGNGTLFAIIDAYSWAMAGVDWGMYRQLPPGTPEGTERTAVPAHAALDLWTNPTGPRGPYDQSLFVKTVTQHLELVGLGYGVVVKIGSLPYEVWPVPPHRMEPVPDPNTFIAGYIYHGPGGERVPLETDVVIRMVQTPCPWDPYGGMGAAQTIMADLYGAAAAAEWHRRFFVNSARPDGVVEVPTSLSDVEFEEFQERWAEAHRGVQNAFRVAMLEHGATWKQTAYSPHDMQFVDLRRADAENIREAFRMSETVLGRGETLNRATAEAQMFQFAANHVVPRLNAVWKRHFLNGRLLPMYGRTGAGVEFDFTSPVPEDREAADRERTSKAGAYEILTRAGVDPDDAAQVVGLPPKMRMAARPEPAVVPAAPPQGGRLALGAGANGHAPALEPAHAPAPAQLEIRATGAVADRLHEALALVLTPGPAHNGHRHALPRGRRDDDGDEDDEPDLTGVLTDLETALAQLERDWEPVQAAWIDELAGQVEKAVAGGELALGSLTLDADDATDVIRRALAGMARTARDRAVRELAGMGVEVEPPSLDGGLRDGGLPLVVNFGGELVEIARVVAELLASGLAGSAGREALRLWRPGAAGTGVAAGVRRFLRDLKGSERRVTFGGALHRAVNLGRFAVWAAAMKTRPGGRVVASEINDRNRCGPCSEIDGRLFETVAEAFAAYGGGSYIECLGRERCRGTTRLVWPADRHRAPRALYGHNRPGDHPMNPARGRKALDAAPVGPNREDSFETLSPDERSTLFQYKGQAYGELNRVLRQEKGQLPDEIREVLPYHDYTETIDGVMDRSRLTGAVEVFRAVRDGRAVFGGAWGGDLTGAEWVEHAYTSTTADEKVVDWFHQKNAPEPAKFRIRAARGVKAVELSGDEYESELLFERGLTMQVVGDTGPGPNRVIDVVVKKKKAKKAA
jgi:HK97 family phage portal protein